MGVQVSCAACVRAERGTAGVRCAGVCQPPRAKRPKAARKDDAERQDRTALTRYASCAAPGMSSYLPRPARRIFASSFRIDVATRARAKLRQYALVALLPCGATTDDTTHFGDGPFTSTR